MFLAGLYILSFGLARANDVPGVCVCGGGGGGWVGVDWIHLNQDRDQWRAVVGTVLNLRAVLNQIVKVDIIHGVSCAELGGATYCDY